MAARNQSKAEAAIAQLKAEGLGPGNGEVIWLELDLTDPQNAKKAAEEFIKREKRLDVLSLCFHDVIMILVLNDLQLKTQQCMQCLKMN
jgi:NAD(P)-dependent dehydrogenase (short-subunit alcohol dehydrogenase family)